MKNNLIKNILFGLIGIYLAFSVGKVIFQGYQVSSQIENLKIQITELQNQNKEQKEKILYYQSPSFREKIARERMGLQKPGEEVMVVMPEEKPKVTENPEDKLSNPQKWWNFFFKNN